MQQDILCFDRGHTVIITIPDALGTMLYAVNIIGHYVIPKHGYGNESSVNAPGRVWCTGDGGTLVSQTSSWIEAAFLVLR